MWYSIDVPLAVSLHVLPVLFRLFLDTECISIKSVFDVCSTKHFGFCTLNGTITAV